jgi:CHASE2 domain-containing sensor protein
VRAAVQSALFLLVGLVVLNFHGISFDLTPWSQVMINEIVDRIHPDPNLQDVAVILFQEKNLRELGAGYPVSYDVQAEVLDAIASYRPRSVFIDFVFVDDRGDSKRLRDSVCKLSKVVEGRLYLAAPLDRDGLATMAEKFDGCVNFATALVESDSGVSGVLTYCSGSSDLRECKPPKDGSGAFLDSPAFAMARDRVAGIPPAAAERMEILWPSGTTRLNRKWMKCSQLESTKARAAVRARVFARIRHHPLEVKEDCPYTNTVSVAHLLGTFDSDVEGAIRGKAVFYGAAFDASGDRVASPTYHDLPGVYLHAMAYDNLVWLDGHYRVVDRALEEVPISWAAVIDVGVLLALVVLWAATSNVPWPERLEGWFHPDEPGYSPKGFVVRAVLTVVLLLAVGISIARGILPSEGAVLLTAVGSYVIYKAIWKDGLFLVAVVLIALAAIGSSRWLHLGPRNIVGYLAFFELARHLADHLHERARSYVEFRTAKYDAKWGSLARCTWLLDRAIGVWLRQDGRRRHGESLGARPRGGRGVAVAAGGSRPRGAGRVRGREADRDQEAPG